MSTSSYKTASRTIWDRQVNEHMSAWEGRSQLKRRAHAFSLTYMKEGLSNERKKPKHDSDAHIGCTSPDLFATASS